MAIEFCQIYILDYGSYKKYLLTNETIMQQLNETANSRMRMALKADEVQKKQLEEKVARQSRDFDN